MIAFVEIECTSPLPACGERVRVRGSNIPQQLRPPLIPTLSPFQVQWNGERGSLFA
jgi:hypothetical protein